MAILLPFHPKKIIHACCTSMYPVQPIQHARWSVWSALKARIKAGWNLAHLWCFCKKTPCLASCSKNLPPQLSLDRALLLQQRQRVRRDPPHVSSGDDTTGLKDSEPRRVQWPSGGGRGCHGIRHVQIWTPSLHLLVVLLPWQRWASPCGLLPRQQRSSELVQPSSSDMHSRSGGGAAQGTASRTSDGGITSGGGAACSGGGGGGMEDGD